MMQEAAYFDQLAAALATAGVATPSLVIDRDRLDGNIAAVRAALGPDLPLRLVDKSLPSISLLAHLMEKLGTSRIMSFHLPVTLAVLRACPEADILYGKPLPVAALADLWRQGRRVEGLRLVRRCVFLIDTELRLEQYARFARQQGVVLRVAFEVDIGMHRGGFPTPPALDSACQRAMEHPCLEVEGIMGYEAHIPAMPALFGGSTAEAAKVRARMQAFAAVLPARARRIINTGGSKTALGYRDPGVASEVALGSAFVKPLDFDVPALAALQPAAFIATPVLKVLETRLPGPLPVTRLLQFLGLFPRQGCFLYGGKWMAHPVHPAAMRENGLWGLSSNQQLMALPAQSMLRPDDMVFFRPTQSEAVLQQFGDLVVIAGGAVVARWPVL